MALFGRRNAPPAGPDGNGPNKAQADAEDQRRLAGGGLPLGAETRLRELAQKPFFTSSLSVSEFALSASDGLRPLGQVMGSSLYHVGWQRTPIYASAELVVLSHAQTHARQLALGRLQQEAALLGAHGVVGVRLTRTAHDWGDNLLEFTAQGTAIALPDAPAPQSPFVCALSGQEFHALRRGGFFPVGFAFGTCTFYHVASYATQWVNQGGFFGGGMYNQELPDYTQAVYTARHSATARMTQEAARVHAQGIIGVRIEDVIRTVEVEDTNDRSRRDLVVEFTAYGTAITQTGGDTAAIDYALGLT